jgi:hypothetical protein
MTIDLCDPLPTMLTDRTFPGAFYRDDVITFLVDFRPYDLYIWDIQWK